MATAKYGVDDIVEYTPPPILGGPVITIVEIMWDDCDGPMYGLRVTDGSKDFPTGARLIVAESRL